MREPREPDGPAEPHKGGADGMDDYRAWTLEPGYAWDQFSAAPVRHRVGTKVTGPTMAEGEKVEVVPASQLEGAVDALDDLIGNSGCMCDRPLVKGPCSKCRAQAVLAALDHPRGR